MASSQEVQWMQQWRFAEKALAEQKSHEMARLDEDRARAMSYNLLSLAPHSYLNPQRRRTSGLVEQQEWFRLWRG